MAPHAVAQSSSATTTQTLYLIDGYAQFFRAYHAIRTPMSSPVTSEPTHMTFGFTGMMLKLLREYQPSHLALVLDVSGDKGTFRSELYPEYKANREPPPSDLKPQVDQCLEMLGQMNVPIYGVERMEADDVIATIVKRMRQEHPDIAIRIISKDKDLQQLLDEKTSLIDVHKDTVTDVAALHENMGITPSQVVDMLTLMGDNADNVPGVPGIGPKTAAQLVAEYETIEGIYDRIDADVDLPKSKQAIKGKRLENLEASRETIPLGRELITLKDDCDVPFNLDATRVELNAMDAPALIETMRVLGFSRHRDEMGVLLGQTASAETADDGGMLGGLFSGTEAADPTVPVAGDYTVVRTKKELDALIKRVRAAGRFAVDTETDGLCAPVVPLAGISIAIETGESFYIPTNS
ncbi:MAG: hypothetical protein MK100_09895, partial [Phycisphaerales bacterium]|nr:hypothetical protein [Phycisphaerales bacterium]